MLPVARKNLEGAKTKEEWKITLAERVMRTNSVGETHRKTLCIQVKLSQCMLYG